MRRFSQRNSLVTLSEINITPLLDLAFVLLIIFVITRPILEGRMKVQLPQGGRAETRSVEKKNIREVEISEYGEYILNRAADEPWRRWRRFWQTRIGRIRSWWWISGRTNGRSLIM